METRVIRVLTDDDIKKISETVSSWRNVEGYEDIKGYCKSSTIEEIEKNGFVLTPGRYVGFADEDDDGLPFEEKIKILSNEYLKQSEKAKIIDEKIKKNLMNYAKN